MSLESAIKGFKGSLSGSFSYGEIVNGEFEGVQRSPGRIIVRWVENGRPRMASGFKSVQLAEDYLFTMIQEDESRAQ